ncbi:MAG: hypothetical protein ACN4G0_15320, partial [Polyangiales bacterium]
MKNFSLGLSLLLCGGFSLAGCGSDSSACSDGQVACDGNCIDPIAPTLAAIQSEIFEPRNCAASACHDSSLPAEGLDLSSVAASGMTLVGINSVQRTELFRVGAGNSDSSYLMNKILGVDMALGTVRMPVNPPEGMDFLCAAEVDAIRQWIDDGADVGPSN